MSRGRTVATGEPSLGSQAAAMWGQDLTQASRPGNNDDRDLRLLAMLRAGAATHLVTVPMQVSGVNRQAGPGLVPPSAQLRC